jgi:glycosyltransferase involved in cell wall biosynthesis
MDWTGAATSLAPRNGRKAVVVQSGARDAYQVALALYEAGMLESLVTDLYWPADRSWAQWLAALLPRSFRSTLMQRNEHRLPSSHVRLCAAMGLTAFLLDKLPHAPFAWKRQAMRRADATLGRCGGRLATRMDAALLSYSYYGYDAFSNYANYASGHSGRGMLFQLHPHPASIRQILQTELDAHPDCAESLSKEWELALPEEDFNHLVAETKMAAHFLVASSFTRQTLVENGTPYERISVIPYGVDCTRFSPGPEAKSIDGPLRLLFVGRINQRKGIKYLLEALHLVQSDVHLTVCGRVVDGLELFNPFAGKVEVRPSVSAEELLAAYRQADLFVFPSVAEGFGQVLLESLACGLPVLSTDRTAAPDLIDEGVDGFVVESRRPDLLAARIDWAASHRKELAAMSDAARRKAQQFTWQRFRHGVARTVAEFMAAEDRCNQSANNRFGARRAERAAGYV